MRCDSCGKEEKSSLLEAFWVDTEDGVKHLTYKHKECGKPTVKRRVRTDPERIIAEVGAKKLSETREGRAVLENARNKYKAELVQPGDPEFKKLYGKQHKEQAEIRRENEIKARKMWAERHEGRL